jgi:hypothetical protein
MLRHYPKQAVVIKQLAGHFPHSFHNYFNLRLLSRTWMIKLFSIKADMVFARTVNNGTANTPSAERWCLFFHSAVCKACWEMAVVKYPDFHSAFAGLIQNDVHIMPPLRAAKVRMRPAFHANRADIGILNDSHICADSRFIFSVLPEERQYIIVPFPVKNLL